MRLIASASPIIPRSSRWNQWPLTVALPCRRNCLARFSFVTPVSQQQWRTVALQVGPREATGSSSVEDLSEEAKSEKRRWEEANGSNKRARHEDHQRSRRRNREDGSEKELPVYATKYPTEEIAAQERQPKRKVAVLIGYSGTGYKGMQLNHHEKTIEGDLFQAFVKAGAISKANADDPKKSSLVRCARTDKGVHAAGNVISLKLVIEDPEVVPKINEALPPQIRVWGIERTNGSFSAYQLCDSRIYEYLIPTYCFLPPHPESFLGRMIVQLAEKENDVEGFRDRQQEVTEFWADTYRDYLDPLIEALDPSIKDEVLKRFLHLGSFGSSDSTLTAKTVKEASAKPDGDQVAKAGAVVDSEPSNENGLNEMQNAGGATQLTVVTQAAESTAMSDNAQGISEESEAVVVEKALDSHEDRGEPQPDPVAVDTQIVSEESAEDAQLKGPYDEIDQQVRNLKAALAKAKRTWRIPQKRLDRVRSTFSRYVGSFKYHNYTVDKSWSDASAQRMIKSFNVDEPIIIGNTEWLSLKVHGQSFMMHQIRKMVSSAALMVRCGCHEGRIQDTFLESRVSIPKAPSLGLLLERPVFDKYNEKLVEFGRLPIDFGRHEKELNEFKQKEIYERIFRDEEKDSIFLAFFSALDSTRSANLLWLTSAGLEGMETDITRDAPEGVGAGNEVTQVEEDDSDVVEDS